MKRGFTLIEMVIVVGIIALALPIIFSVLFSIIRQQAKVYALKQVKREGDFVLNSMENTIRGYAVGVFRSCDENNVCTDEICNAPGPGEDASYFKDKFGTWFRYEVDPDNKVASESSIAGADAELTTTKVKITDFSLTCSATSSFSPPIVSVQFTVSSSDEMTFPEDQATLNYSTQIKLRNY